MPTRRVFLGAASALATGGCLGNGSTDDQGESADGNGSAGLDDVGEGGGPSLSAPAFEDGASIPSRYTCDGEDVSPPLRVEGAPARIESLALLVEDPDAPTESPFVHWLVWNVPPDTTEIPEGVPREETVPDLGEATQGTNDFDELGYRGPCPPAEDDPHTYQFTVMGVETTLDLDPGADAAAFRSAVGPHIAGGSVLTGTYGREG